MFAVLRQITCFFFANQKINRIKLTFRDYHHAHRAGLEITMLRNSIFLILSAACAFPAAKLPNNFPMYQQYTF